MKVWKLLGMAVLAGAVIWAGIAVIGKLSNPNSATSAGEGQVVEAKLGNVEATISASGYLVAHSKAMLSFDSAGIIADMAVEVGSRVTRGQVLAKLDTSSLERAVAQAEAGLRTDQINLDKARNPYTETDFTQAEAAVTQAEAGLRTAQINLDKAQDLGNALKAVITARVALNVAQDALEEAKIGVLAAVRDAEV
ncbi:MAG: biotin/lipoyl-binding protein, partial [Dehalococcoidia bacterium]|nr:biotin/lipoyl-binding protein [Dehalococcoidia bacterium]